MSQIVILRQGRPQISEQGRASLNGYCQILAEALREELSRRSGKFQDVIIVDSLEEAFQVFEGDALLFMSMALQDLAVAMKASYPKLAVVVMTSDMPESDGMVKELVYLDKSWPLHKMLATLEAAD